MKMIDKVMSWLCPVCRRRKATSVQLIFSGPIVDSEQTAQWLIDTLQEAVSDRDVVIIDPPTDKDGT